MKSLTVVLAFLGLVLLSERIYSQSLPETSFKNASFLMRDSSTQVAIVDVKLLLTRNILQFGDNQSKGWTLKDVRMVTVDSTTYQVRKLENIADTLKVVEKFVDGKISLFRSPRVTTNEEIFAEKDNKLYQLRILKRYVKEGLFYVNEYASTLKFLMLDCSAIDQARLETNVALSIPSVAKIVGKYNSKCGWQSTLSSRKQIKPLVTFGVAAGGMFSTHKLSYRQGTYSGKATVAGVFAGPTLNIDFRKYNDTRLRFELLFEKLGGNGEATTSYGGDTHKHAYDIFQLRNVIAFDLLIHKSGTTSIYGGLGTVFQVQVQNNTEVTWFGTFEHSVDLHSSKDKFNMSPLGSLYVKAKRFGVKYELTALAINMKATELLGFDHRLSIHYDLKTK